MVTWCLKLTSCSINFRTDILQPSHWHAKLGETEATVSMFDILFLEQTL